MSSVDDILSAYQVLEGSRRKMERVHLHSEAKDEESFSSMTTKPYTSCIVFNGRPILPPVITPRIRSEMAYYKELAINIERKRQRLTEKHSSSTPVSNSVTSYSTTQKLCSSDCGFDNFSQSRLQMSCTPSVASTDLTKYMNATCDNEDSTLWSNFNDEEIDEPFSSNQDNSVIQQFVDENMNNEDGTGGSEEDMKLSVTENCDKGSTEYPQLRRSSYTLDAPSPVLLAHLKKLSIDAQEIGKLTDLNQKKLLPHPNVNDLENKLCPSVPSTPLTNQNLEPQSSESVFTNILLQCSQYVGRDKCDNIVITQRKDFEDLVKQHDEALDNLKKRFIATVTHMVASAKSQDEIIGHINLGPKPLKLSDKMSSENNCSNLQQSALETTKSPCQSVNINDESVKVYPNFDRVSAAVKGYLTRRLFRTQKVQAIVQTIKDTLEFAFELHSDTPIENEYLTPQDAELHERLLAQLSSACFEIHDIFFKLTTKEQMAVISHDRALLQGKLLKDISFEQVQQGQTKLSSATLKAIDRRRRRSNDSRNSISPRSWRLFKSRSPRETPVFKERYCRNLEAELRSISASNFASPYQPFEPRSFSAMSETSLSRQYVRRSMDRQPILRKTKIKKHLSQRPYQLQV